MIETVDVNLSIRIEVEVDSQQLIHDIGMGLEYVHSIVELRNDGFGRLTITESTRQNFVSPTLEES